MLTKRLRGVYHKSNHAFKKRRMKNKAKGKISTYKQWPSNSQWVNKPNTANVDLLKMVPVEILLNFGNYFRTLQLGF